MERLCKNCEWWYEGGREGGTGYCRSSRAMWTDRHDEGVVAEDAFCSDFFPPNPSCNECRWWENCCGDDGLGHCRVDHPTANDYGPADIPKTYLDDRCSRFQPNGVGE
jgi:hypothetical protein